jgi:hypothetical protein
MSGTQLYVKLPLDHTQRTKLVAKGRISPSDKHILMYLDENAVRMLNPTRVYITEHGEVVILDHIERENDSVRLHDFYGRKTTIIKELVDYIIENDKQTFDSDCIRKLYELQDRELEEEMRRIQEERERKRKIAEAREILREEIEQLESNIRDREIQR